MHLLMGLSSLSYLHPEMIESYLSDSVIELKLYTVSQSFNKLCLR